MAVIAGVASLILAAQIAQVELTPVTGAAITQQRDAVDKSERIMAQAQKRPGLLAQYLYMREARERDPKIAFRLIFNQYLSWFESWVGDYAGSRTTFSIAQPPQKDDAAPPGELGYAPVAAVDAIAEFAKGRQAIFFNENHNIALTRTLTVELLSRLRADGYDTFAAETLYADDRGLAQRGYPTSDSGFYTEEPIYAEMVRTALKLGYKVVAYEDESNKIGDAREREQAKNLYQRTFGRDPPTRLVVNAGFTHVQKAGKYFDGVAMATHFAKLSGIDPITVEQTVLIPHEHAEDDHPVYRRIVRTTPIAEPTVFRNGAGALWSLRAPAFDVSVVFPAEVYRHGQPTWAAIGGLRRPYLVSAELCRNALPCLVEARYADEGDDAIPADRCVFDPLERGISNKDRVRTSSDAVPTAELYLRPGSYRIVARDVGNRIIGSQSAVVGAGA